MRFLRNLSGLSVWALSFGYAVGWGAFVMPGAKFLPDAGPVGTVIGVVAGALAMCVIGWNYYRMARSEPGTGGAYTYATKALGADYGYLTAWSLSLAYMAILWANATALVLLVRYIFGDALQFGWHDTVAGFDVYLGEVLLSIAMMVFAGVCCLSHKKTKGRINSACALFMIISIAVCFGVAVFRHEGGLAAMAPAFAPNGASETTQVLRILAMMPWAFVGFEAVTHSSLEFNFPLRRLWRILVLAVVASAAAYIMLALLPVLAFPESYASWSEYIGDFSNLYGFSTMPTFAAVQRTMGSFGIGLIAATMLAAIHTGIVGTIVAMSRLLYTLSSEKVLPGMRWLGRLDDNGSPRNAIMFVVGISLVIPFFGRTVIGWPIDVSSIGAAVAFCCTSAAAFKFAREQGDRITKITGLAGVVMSMIFCLLLLVPNYLSTSALSAEAYLVLALWCIAGFLLYRQVFERDKNASVNSIEGTGLGMPITKGIVDLMKGTINVESAQGKGTEFIVRLTLPFAPDVPVDSGAAVAADDGSQSPLDHSTLRILVVEDNEINREIATTLLEQAGFKVDTAVNGKIAVEKFVRCGPGHFDAILMDVQMPVLDGYAATRAIRAVEAVDGPRVPIIALSANAFESDVKNALDAGMDAHVPKPIKIQNLMKTLDGLLRRKTSTSKPDLKGDVLHALARMGCDVKAALRETYIGNIDFYMRMLAKLPRNTCIAEMRSAFVASNPTALFAAAHNLKGLYASLGLTPLHAMCSEIVEIARAGSVEGVEAPLARLEKAHAEVVALVTAKE